MKPDGSVGATTKFSHSGTFRCKRIETDFFFKNLCVIYVYVQLCPTFYGCQDYAGVVVGDDVGVSVLGFVDLQVGMLPGELLTRIDGLWRESTE